MRVWPCVKNMCAVEGYFSQPIPCDFWATFGRTFGKQVKAYLDSLAVILRVDSKVLNFISFVNILNPEWT